MTEGRRRRERRVEGQSFMDVARQAYARHLALEKWRDLQDVRETNGFDWPTAAREAGAFPERFPYHGLWAARWAEHVQPAAAEGDTGRIFAAIEAAVTAALADEEAERAARGDQPVDLDPDYRAFLDRSLGRLARQTTDTYESPAP